VVLVYVVIQAVSGGGLPSPPAAENAAGAGPAAGAPFGYSASAQAAFSQRVTLGESQVLFQLSPGGAVATAARVAAFRREIVRAVRGTNIPADLLEGLVYLESAGRSQVIAGNSVANAAGLTQIQAATGTEMLGLKINLSRSAKLTAEIGSAQDVGDNALVAKLEASRAKADPRFDPTSELAATVRYLRTAEASFGNRADLAVVAYHSGIGELEQILDLYNGGHAVPYTQLYFDATPYSHTAAYMALNGLTDSGALYYWRVLAAERIMSLWRTDRPALRRWASRAEQFPSNALVLVPPTAANTFSTPSAVASAYWTKPQAQLVPLPRNAAALHLAYATAMGSLASKVGAPRAIYRGLRPSAIRMLIQMAAWVDQLAGTSAPLTVATSVSDPKYSALLGFDDDPPAATGYTFQIDRTYSGAAQRSAFQFVLDRLQDLNLIAWIRGVSTIEITVAPDAASVIAHGIGH